MKRILAISLLAAAVVALATLGTGAKDSSKGKRFKVELDNAFGLVNDADLKIAGVRAGKVKSLSLDRTDMRAIVTVEVTQGGFDDLRTDVTCETRPQSLIGEYFIDCNPGKASTRLKPGSTIPVEQTRTTVPLDLINDIMRRPYRERSTILLSELGAGLAARGEDLNETIRRAVPALRQVDKLLATLREQRKTISALYRDADRVTTRVAASRDDVVDFIEEARDTARTAAVEQDAIADQWRTFPTFLGELRPTLQQLEATADEQIPALQNLRRAAPHLERLFDTLGPYSKAAQPAVRSLAEAAKQGRPAVRAARPVVGELRRGTDDLPEAAKNLAITLEHLDDPRFTTEKDVRAGRGPNGGFTGLEALIRYFFRQSQAINLFDASSYMLKASLFLDRPCANYADAKAVKTGQTPPRCRAWLGQNQPGVTTPDFSAGGDGAGVQGAGGAEPTGPGARAVRDGGEPRAAGGAGSSEGNRRAGSAPTRPGGGPIPGLDGLLDGGRPAPQLPDTPPLPEAPPEPGISREAEGLLDFLVGS